MKLELKDSLPSKENDIRDNLLNEALFCIEIYNKSIDPVGLYQDSEFVEKMRKIEDKIKIYYGRYGEKE